MEEETKSPEKDPNRPRLLSGGKGYVREKFRGKTFLIPSVITVGGVFCGFLAIISAFNGRYIYASKCIGLAIVLDGLDGRVARRLNATTAFGREFDSLSDLIAFGVAPAVLMYSWGFSNVADEFGLLVAFIYLICCATRLARFNVKTTEDSSLGAFSGLPSPGAGAALVAIPYCFQTQVTSASETTLLMVYTLIIAAFMVLPVAYSSVKKIQLSDNDPRLVLVGLATVVALLWKFNNEMILVVATAYAWSGPIVHLLSRFKRDGSDKKNIAS